MVLYEVLCCSVGVHIWGQHCRRQRKGGGAATTNLHPPLSLRQPSVPPQVTRPPLHSAAAVWLSPGHYKEIRVIVRVSWDSSLKVEGMDTHFALPCFLLPLVWNVNEGLELPAAVLDHKANLKDESNDAGWWSIKLQGGWVPDEFVEPL